MYLLSFGTALNIVGGANLLTKLLPLIMDKPPSFQEMNRRQLSLVGVKKCIPEQWWLEPIQDDHPCNVYPHEDLFSAQIDYFHSTYSMNRRKLKHHWKQDLSKQKIDKVYHQMVIFQMNKLFLANASKGSASPSISTLIPCQDSHKTEIRQENM